MGQRMMGGYDMMYGYGWIYMLLGILFMVGLIFLIVWLVRQSGAVSSGREETALDILKKRYANSEIDKEEFERMKRDIM